MRFLIDAMLPRQFSKILNELGHEARHVKRLKLGAILDETIWDFACSNKEILISKDRDFVALLKKDNRTRLIWYRVPNANYDILVESFKQKLPQIMSRLDSDDSLIEII